MHSILSQCRMRHQTVYSSETSHYLPIFKALPNTSGVAFMLHTPSLLQYFYVTNLALASLGCNQVQYQESHNLGSQEQLPWWFFLLLWVPLTLSASALRGSSSGLVLSKCLMAHSTWISVLLPPPLGNPPGLSVMQLTSPSPYLCFCMPPPSS